MILASGWNACKSWRSISDDLRDVKQQQQGLDVAVLCLEKNSSGPATALRTTTMRQHRL
jgi:hypothetical protein